MPGKEAGWGLGPRSRWTRAVGLVGLSQRLLQLGTDAWRVGEWWESPSGPWASGVGWSSGGGGAASGLGTRAGRAPVWVLRKGPLLPSTRSESLGPTGSPVAGGERRSRQPSPAVWGREAGTRLFQDPQRAEKLGFGGMGVSPVEEGTSGRRERCSRTGLDALGERSVYWSAVLWNCPGQVFLGRR
ncbi:uncharacterized protein LOC144281373 [Canis aureus]